MGKSRSTDELAKQLHEYLSIHLSSLDELNHVRGKSIFKKAAKIMFGNTYEKTVLRVNNLWRDHVRNKFLSEYSEKLVSNISNSEKIDGLQKEEKIVKVEAPICEGENNVEISKDEVNNELNIHNVAIIINVEPGMPSPKSVVSPKNMECEAKIGKCGPILSPTKEASVEKVQEDASYTLKDDQSLIIDVHDNHLELLHKEPTEFSKPVSATRGGPKVNESSNNKLKRLFNVETSEKKNSKDILQTKKPKSSVDPSLETTKAEKQEDCEDKCNPAIISQKNYKNEWWQKSNIINKNQINIETGLRRLEVGEWLNDEIINSFIFTQTVNANKLGRKVWFFTTHTMASITYLNGDNTIIAKNNMVFDYDIWLLPTGVNHNHWILFVISFKRKVVLCLDSLLNHKLYGKPVLETVMKFVDRAYQECRNDSFDLQGWNIYFPTENPHQNNGNDCGVHVCVWSHIICTSTHLVFTHNNISSARIYIMNELLEFKDPQNKFPVLSCKVETKPQPERRIVGNIIKDSVPTGFHSTLHFCSSLLQNELRNEQRSVCSKGIKCMSPNTGMIPCYTCSDRVYHLECLRVKRVPKKLFCLTCKTPESSGKHLNVKKKQ